MLSASPNSHTKPWTGAAGAGRVAVSIPSHLEAPAVRLPRFRIRTLMIAVAVVALVCAFPAVSLLVVVSFGTPFVLSSYYLRPSRRSHLSFERRTSPRRRCDGSCPMPFPRMTTWRWLIAVAVVFAGVAMSIRLVRTTIGPELGFALTFVLAMSGALDTRIGLECLYVLVNTIGVAGLNSSGRRGDDPFMGLYYFPWLILTIVAAITLTVVIGVRIAFRKR